MEGNRATWWATVVTAPSRVSTVKREVHCEQVVCRLQGPAHGGQGQLCRGGSEVVGRARRAAYPRAQDPPRARSSVTTDTLVSSSTYQLRVDQLEELRAVGGGRRPHLGAANEDGRREAQEDPGRGGSTSRVESWPDSASPELRSWGCRDPPPAPRLAFRTRVCWSAGPTVPRLGLC